MNGNLKYELVWSDEFETDGPVDNTKWSFQTGGNGWGNNELEYYTDGDNAEIKNGKLLITARAEKLGGREVTSARVTTKGKGDWLYGKIAVRSKLPKGVGTWPAIWMMPSGSVYGHWPNSGEIDIMEHVGYDENNILSTVHTQSFNHVVGTQKGTGNRYKNVTDGFHVYSIEWLPEKIIFFVDDTVNYIFERNLAAKEVTYREWPFDQKFHLILNLAFGGNLGGAWGVDYSCLPAVMEVDWVRVYKREDFSL